VWQTLDVPALLLTLAALLAVFRYKISLLRVLAGSALAGVGYFVVTGTMVRF
jgi:chromate transporter